MQLISESSKAAETEKAESERKCTIVSAERDDLRAKLASTEDARQLFSEKSEKLEAQVEKLRMDLRIAKRGSANVSPSTKRASVPLRQAPASATPQKKKKKKKKEEVEEDTTKVELEVPSKPVRGPPYRKKTKEKVAPPPPPPAFAAKVLQRKKSLH